LIKPALLVAVVLLVPVVPFLLFGSQFEAWIAGWLEPTPPPLVLAALVAAVLASDILLPVPSSAVSTLAGAKLGALVGTAASWIGLSAGAILGFALARWLGRPLAERFAGAADLARSQRLADRHGAWVVVLTRAIPVLAEASVLLLGATGLAWRRFLLPMAASNLGIAVAYSAFGQLAERHAMLPTAMGVSIALPILAATMIRRWLPGDDHA
jgi:uncharacterized membrane protein YdjX (TVP38/TMEM64 family)